MKISLEISLYPLDDDFLNIITDIVERLNADTQVSVLTNTMSTQVFGEFEAVMSLLNETVRYSFETYGKQVFVAKFLNSDLNPKNKL
ncbi:YkoF family thiamine/hydroxymethylpyrimidine-binding protein [Aliikangiella sp. IMCC44359]|uniref:YkoF family thiamine/hydroxymethylpyrimidine-binding protein n=1 Tax=Aliikangiella sp. IMCC44359 TaxID=3459125 RepID=UPI00403AF99E